MTHKAGFVAIIGKPNVGKSTLLNKMLGEQLSVVTPKAQTTRHRIKGILNDPEYQIVFSDTPGIMQPAYKLHKKMMDAVDSTLVDADLVMLVVEIHERALSEEVAERLKNLVVPFILVINKVDLADQEMLEQKVIFWKELLNPGAIIPVSATEKFNIQPLVQTIVSYLPESPAFFDKEDVSDRNVRFFVTEIIREKILVNYQKEIPYSCEVVITDYKEEPEIHRIRCEIYVDRESQKAILLGHKGEAIKKLGTDARKKIEKLVDCHIYLELTVKVRENWRDDEKQLDKFGYNEE
ncbi:MAG: GTPase Era [Bacteroidetes bacterium]|nr:GTPase Era [Bacteroidota bacterium]MBK9424609.1 GTPase Era [Bacteroidota bacterium]